MLLVVAFVACLAAPGGAAEAAAAAPATPGRRCETVEVPWDGPMLQCQMFGQAAVATWIGEHRGFAMRGGYRCLPGRAI